MVLAKCQVRTDAVPAPPVAYWTGTTQPGSQDQRPETNQLQQVSQLQSEWKDWREAQVSSGCRAGWGGLREHRGETGGRDEGGGGSTGSHECPPVKVRFSVCLNQPTLVGALFESIGSHGRPPS